MIDDLIECKKCGELCQIDGEFPKFSAWCETCNDYADCNIDAYIVEWFASRIDEEYDKKIMPSAFDPLTNNKKSL